MSKVSLFFKSHKRTWIDILVLFCTLVFISVSYLIFKPFYRVEGMSDGFAAKLFSYFCIVAWLVVGIVFYFRKKLTFTRFLFMLFILAVILRVAYMLITPVDYRQHDTNFDEGHEGYAWIIYSTGQLPSTNANQFYHPPLNALVQAAWMHIFQPFLQFANLFLADAFKYNLASKDVLYETTQIVSCFEMTLVVYLVIRIFKDLNLKKIAKIFGICFIIFFPRLIQFAAQENNDPICVMFAFFTIFFTFRYAKKKSWFNVIGIGLSVGLAMMSKFSGALIAIVPGCYFIYDFVQSIRKRKELDQTGKMPTWADLFIKYFAVVVIAFGLGFWFQIYALVRFNQPIGYVWPISKESDLYHGDMSIFSRLINIFDFPDLYKYVYANTRGNYNLFNFTIKSSLFGEFSFANGDYLAVFATTINYLFVLSAIVNFVIYLIHPDKKNMFLVTFAIILVVSQYAAQIYFNYRYPFGCTMDFRYIVPIVFGFGLMQTLSIDKLFYDKSWKGYFTKVTTLFGTLVIASTVVFYLIII